MAFWYQHAVLDESLSIELKKAVKLIDGLHEDLSLTFMKEGW